MQASRNDSSSNVDIKWDTLEDYGEKHLILKSISIAYNSVLLFLQTNFFL